MLNTKSMLVILVLGIGPAIVIRAALSNVTIDSLSPPVDAISKAMEVFQRAIEDMIMPTYLPLVSISPEIDPNQPCPSTWACGWCLYDQFAPVRQCITYKAVKNICVCPKGSRCVQTDEDLTRQHYVYYCSKNPGDDAIELPETAV